MQMISKTKLGQIFRTEADRITKIRTLQTHLNDLTLDIPLMRRKVTELNMRWILRNVKVNNSEHINLNKIIKLIKEII